MKILRYLLALLAVAGALLLAAALLAMVPQVQTWAVQAKLNSTAGVTASIGSISAGFGRIDVEDAQFSKDGAVLKIPELQATLPLVSGFLNKRANIRSLVSKGWRLDLSHPKTAPIDVSALTASPRPPAEAAGDAVRAAVGALAALKVPIDMTLDGVELEGDIILANAAGGSPIQVHVTITGGGLAAGHEGQFDVVATVSGSSIPEAFNAASGRITATLGPDRSVDALKVRADFDTESTRRPDNPGLSAEIATERSPTGQTFVLGAFRGDRRIAGANATLKTTSDRLKGSWTLDLRDRDIAPFAPFVSLPKITATGAGDYDTDFLLAKVHAGGHLDGTVGNLKALSPSLERFGDVRLKVDFDLTAEGPSIHVEALKVTAGISAATAELRTLHGFSVNAKTGAFDLGADAGDFAETSFGNVPLVWLSQPSGRLGFASGTVDGAFTVKPAKDGFRIASTRPLTAKDVSLLGLGTLLGGGLDMTATVAGSYSPSQWSASLGSLDVSKGGGDLVNLGLEVSKPAGADQAVALKGTWTAHMEAIAKAVEGAVGGFSPGRDAQGTFSASLADSADVQCEFTIAGADPTHTVSGTAHVDLDYDGDFNVTAPIRVSDAAGTSSIEVDGDVDFDHGATRLNLKFTSDDIALGQLRVLAGALLAQGRFGQTPGTSYAVWGNLVGRAAFNFKKLRTNSDAYDGVAGTIQMEQGEARLIGGRVWLLQHSLGKIDALIAFNPASPTPYTLTGNVVVDDVDATAIFGKPRKGEDPVVEGRFSVAGRFFGDGTDMQGLAADAREEISLKGTTGILRILKTNVADAVTETPSPVTDSLGAVGSTVGAVLGVKKDNAEFGKNKVSKSTDAVINFTYDAAEIGFDQLLVTAVLNARGDIHIASIDMTAPDERLTGSGDITFVASEPILQRPFGADLLLGVKGGPLKLLSSAGLLSATTDSLGYQALKGPFHLGGSLSTIDETQWHDLLASVIAPKKANEAATRPAASGSSR